MSPSTDMSSGRNVQNRSHFGCCRSKTRHNTTEMRVRSSPSRRVRALILLLRACGPFISRGHACFSVRTRSSEHKLTTSTRRHRRSFKLLARPPIVSRPWRAIRATGHGFSLLATSLRRFDGCPSSSFPCSCAYAGDLYLQSCCLLRKMSAAAAVAATTIDVS